MTAGLPRDVGHDEVSWYERWQRGTGCPPPDLLLPALEGTLRPEPLGEAVRAHVAACGLCQELAAALGMDVTPEEALRIRARIGAATRAVPRRWVAYAAAAALVIAGGAAYVRWSASRPGPSVPASPPARAQQQVQAPVYVLALHAPDLQLPPESLTLRSGSPDAYAAALERALEPYLRGEYGATIVTLEPVVRNYPDRPHPAFYLGVSYLLEGRAADAVAPLTRARDLAGPRASLYPEAAWYLAVALERSGRSASAVAVLGDLCGSGGPRDAAACDGMRALSR